MGKWDFLKEFQKEFAFDLSLKEDGAILTNTETRESIEIFEEEYDYTVDPKDGLYVEYIVCFTTQHRHFEDLSDVAEYIRLILTDEVLPIEFFLHRERRFDGDIKKTDFYRLTIEILAVYYGYSVEYLSPFEYEIHSWSGRYNVDRRIFKS